MMSNIHGRPTVELVIGAIGPSPAPRAEGPSLSEIAGRLAALGGDGSKTELLGGIMLGQALGQGCGLCSRGSVSRHFDAP